MGCCGSKDDGYDGPMSGSTVVGREGGAPVNREEQRERAAAAAEARAKAESTRGQQGSVSKIRKPVEPSNQGGGVEKNLVWD